MTEEHRLVGKDRRARLEGEKRLGLGDGLGGLCGRQKVGGGQCEQKAGHQTDHEGVGPCSAHGGNSKRERKIGAWMMARRFGDELDVTPWDALLVVLRRAAAKSAWYAQELAATDDVGLLPGGEHHDLVREAERADAALAKYAKMALDAGVAERLVQSVTEYASQLTRVLNAAVLSDALGLSDEQVLTARRLMAKEIRVIEAERVGVDVVEADVVEAAPAPLDEGGGL